MEFSRSLFTRLANRVRRMISRSNAKTEAHKSIHCCRIIPPAIPKKEIMMLIYGNKL